MSDHTPTRQHVRAVYVGAFDIDPIDKGKDAAEAFHGESFDRFIAKVKADALREAALNWGMWVKANPHLSPSPGPWCLMEADRIEGEA